MPLSLVKRSTNGAPVSAVQNDANMTAIEGAVNTHTTDIAAKATSASLTAAFTSFSGPLGQVTWANVVGRPTELTTPTMFRATKADATQTVSASGGVVVHFTTENFDYGSGFSTGTYSFTAPSSGVYSLGASVQVALDSGTPTDVSIVVSLRVNGSPIDQVTYDNSGT